MAGDENRRAECRNCGAPLHPSHEGPCPSCGQRNTKIVTIEITAFAHGTASMTATVVRWQERYRFLLDSARQLRDQRHHEAAIVTAQTACEVCTEVVLTDALRDRVGDAAVEDLITNS